MRSTGTAAVVLGVAIGLLAITDRGAADEKPIDWSAHMGGLAFVIGPEPGLEEAKFTGRPPMYVFTSANDEWCPKFARRTWSNGRVRKLIASYTPVLVDADEHKEMAETLIAPLVPAVVWVDFDGETIFTAVGDAPIEIFLQAAEIAADRAPEVKPTKEYKALLELGKQLDKLVAGDDPKATYAMIEKIRAVRLGRDVQARATAADTEITKDGRAGIEQAQTWLEKKRRIDAIKTLKKVVKQFDWHPIGKEAATFLEEIRSKKR